MTVRVANCPSCGASIEFANAASVMVVCVHCGTASVRRDADLEKMGRVAEIAPIESALSLGASGRWKSRRWTAIGQVQLDHGKGPWNEWCLSFEGGEIGWLAEAQGQVIVSFLRPDIPSPLDQELGVGAKVTLGDRTFVVAETGTARVTSARGELPEAITVGETYQYLDLHGPGGAFATIALHPDGSAETYVGSVIPADSLGVDASTVTGGEARRATPDRVGCPGCGSPVQIRDPANARRVVCSSCGSMMDPREKKLRVIEKAKLLEARPTIPIGAKARLRGQDFEVLAFLVRSVRSEGVRYPWQEYLLRRADGAYRWLVSSDGHWSFVEPLGLGDVVRHGSIAKWNGTAFRHFQGGRAVVDHVQGEVYWEVSIGETVKADDYVAPPLMLSFEQADGEVVASVGQYLPGAELAAAFPGVTRWPWAKGVAPHEPNPWSVRARRSWAVSATLAAATIVLMFVVGAHHRNSVVARINARAPLPPATATDPASAPAEDKGVVFSDEFRLEPSSANVEIDLVAEVSNAWVGVDGALVNLDTGDVHSFALEAERWWGTTDGESWSEGSNESSTYVGSVPAGRYSLRLDAEAQSQDPSLLDAGIGYTVVARSQVPSRGRGIALILLLLAPPLICTLARSSFEARRWSTSDHAG